MDFLDEDLGGFGIDGFHDGLEFIAGFEKLKKTVGDVVRKIADKNVFLVYHFYFMFAVSQLDGFSDIEGGKYLGFGLVNQGDDFGLTWFFNETHRLRKGV